MKEIKLPENIILKNDGSLITLRCNLCEWETVFTQTGEQKEIEKAAKERSCLPEIR